MPASSLLTLIDDIASTLDDVAAMTKVASKKTAGVLGDDLALNAQQMTGLHADRELPLVWSVAKGSFINKVVLVPLALVISQLTPWLVNPLLMAGGAFLCFEGFEKIVEKFFGSHAPDSETQSAQHTLTPHSEAHERERIKGAIRTDFILSAEIIVISLGSVAHATWWKQLTVLSGISVIMTVGVYGLVAIIVKMDDVGLHLTRAGGWRLLRPCGHALLWFAPFLMRMLGIGGTIAMFLVGGGIIVHSIPTLHHLEASLSSVTASGLALLTGLACGALCVLTLHIWTLVRNRFQRKA